MTAKYPKKQVIGITGGIATGKSTVLKELARRGFSTLSSDDLAHQCLKSSHPCFRPVVQHFGAQILDTHRQIDRKALGKIVFSKPSERKWLERRIHPFVIKGLKAFIRNHHGLIALDIPLLYEAHLSNLVDFILVVWCTHKDQIKRLQWRNRLHPEDAKSRLRAQWPLSYKKKHADYLLPNTGGLSELRRKVEVFLDRLNSDTLLEKA